MGPRVRGGGGRERGYGGARTEEAVGSRTDPTDCKWVEKEEGGFETRPYGEGEGLGDNGLGFGVGCEWAPAFAGVGKGERGNYPHPNPLPGREKGKMGSRPYE